MLAGLFLAVDLVLWNHAIADVGAGIATVLGNLQVLFVALIAWALLRERPDRRFLAMLITSALPRLPAAFSSLLLLLQPGGQLAAGGGPFWASGPGCSSWSAPPSSAPVSSPSAGPAARAAIRLSLLLPRRRPWLTRRPLPGIRRARSRGPDRRSSPVGPPWLPAAQPGP